MSRATNAGAQGSAGSFATSRRGGLTIAEIEHAKASIGPRATVAMIARFVGRSEDDVRALVSGMSGNGLPRPAATALSPQQEAAYKEAQNARRKAEFVRMWEEGYTVTQIGRHLNMGETSVRAMRDALGLHPRQQGAQVMRWTPRMDHVLKTQYVEGGQSATAVAKQLGVSRGAMMGRAFRLGLLRPGSRTTSHSGQVAA